MGSDNGAGRTFGRAFPTIFSVIALMALPLLPLRRNPTLRLISKFSSPPLTLADQLLPITIDCSRVYSMWQTNSDRLRKIFKFQSKSGLGNRSLGSEEKRTRRKKDSSNKETRFSVCVVANTSANTHNKERRTPRGPKHRVGEKAQKQERNC